MRILAGAEYQVEGPPWLDRERYDVVETIPLGSNGQVPTEVDLAVLAVAAMGLGRGAGGPTPTGAMRMATRSNNRLTGSLTLARLCKTLSKFLGRPVLDLTELKGTYDIDLSWTPDDNERMGGKLPMPMGAPPPFGGAASSDGKMTPPAGASDSLESKKSLADIVVVDHAEKVPTGN